jgi:hypothetical protein
MKSQILTTVAVQAESTFAGSGTGTIYRVTGVRQFEPSFDSVLRTTKVSVWRQETGQKRAGYVFGGRLDVEGSPGNALRLLLSNLLCLKDPVLVEDPGNTTYTFRPKRSQPFVIESLKFYVAYESGPWETYSGCVITSLRCTTRGQNITNISCDFMCASVQSVDSDPVWTIATESLNSIVASDAVLTIDAVPVTGMIELSCEINLPRDKTRMSRDGVAGRFSSMGPAVITGAFNEYFGSEGDLPQAVRDGSEVALKATLNAGSGTLLEFDFPRVAPQSGQPNPLGQADVTSQIPFKVLADADLDEGSETHVRFIHPT